MTIYIVDLEAVDTRYTKEWKKYLPLQLKRHTNSKIEVISGGNTPQATTPGAFLNFGGTNVYKAKQMQQIGELFCNGKIKDGDYFLYTDAWNPTVLQLRYMAELLGINIRIGGLWHAGSYDPQDFLGRLIGDKPWVRNAERSMFETYDNNFFASDLHINMFVDTFKEFGNYVGLTTDKTKVRRVGWPMEYLEGSMSAYKGMDKKDIILFPHRIAPEKQPDIFYDLKDALPQYEFVVCQEKELSKNEYHNLLGEAKMVFSANLQETLGISWYEGCLVDTMPLVPDRLSYTEMAIDEFKYPSEWTQDFKSYQKNKKQLVQKIDFMMTNYKKIIPQIWKQKQQLQEKYFSGKQLYGDING
jgi:glycosyltransferase involved in cell wall biosynthesis